MRTLSRFAGLFATMMPGADVRALLDELSARTEEELDYRIEADNQRASRRPSPATRSS